MQQIFLKMRQIGEGIKEAFDADRFNAQEAARALPCFFSQVERFDYAVGMRVTDTSLLVQYARSCLEDDCDPPVEYWKDLHDILVGEINTKGFFELTKRCALFVCRKPTSSL